MSEGQNKTRPARQGAKKPAAAAATTVAKGPAIQTTQTEQDAAALKAKADLEASAQGKALSSNALAASGAVSQTTQTEQDAAALKAAATVVKDLAVQTTKAEQDEEAIKAAAATTAKTELETKVKDESSALLEANNVESDVIRGAFKVRAKSERGFWRCGVQFKRQQETLVLVVESEPSAVPGVHAKSHEPEDVVIVNSEKAMRIHNEPNLISEYVDLDDVIILDEMQQ